MQFAKITGKRVAKVLASGSPPAGATRLPKGHQVQVGDDVRFLDERWCRKSVERCVVEGLIEKPGEFSEVRWAGGRWQVRADYSKANYWYKESGEKVNFTVGQEPDGSMTDIEPPDFEAVWDERTGWHVPEEVKAERLRRRRTELLERSDFTMLPDAPVKDVEGWKRYRQELRDVPLQKGWPDEVRWPEPPKEEMNERYILSTSE